MEVPAIDYHYLLVDKPVLDIYSIETKWRRVQGLAYDEDSRAHWLAKEIRRRKGLSENLPDLKNYV